ncbi:MAG: hypothetical protein KY455_01535 [Euryarchaeota archaeon]|nr:hypothetical protein [Euryarchaeota archaeon]
MHAWRPFVAVAFVMLLLGGSPQPAAGHPGDRDPVLTDEARLQAESYHSAYSRCDPTGDGEHTAPRDRIGDRVLFMPQDNCYVIFYNVDFPVGATAKAFRVAPQSSGVTVEMRLFVDGVFKAVGRYSTDPAGGSLMTVPFSSASHFDAGTHTIRWEMQVVRGEYWQNSYTDWISFELDCMNAAPQPTPTTDGLAGGLDGWAGYDYTFRAGDLVDPDGDPFTVHWQWPDGSSSVGGNVTQRFGTLEDTTLMAHEVTIRIVEDVSARCPDVGPLETVHGPWTFTTVPGLVPLFVGLGPGASCNGGLVVPSWRSDDVVLGACTVGATADTYGATEGVVGNVTFRLDGAELTVSSEAPHETVVDAVALGGGDHLLELCVEGADDKYGRSFCGASYAFRAIPCTNAFARFDRVVADGLAGLQVGWAGHDYTLTLSGAADPDGDAVTVRWAWDDGSSLFGTTVSRAFPSGEHPYHIVLEEDLSVRCPDAGVVPARYGADALPPPDILSFQALSDWSPVLTNPRHGQGCVYTEAYPGLIATGQFIIGSCRIQAQVTTGAPGVQVEGTMFLDGNTFATHDGPAFWAWYESFERPTAERTIEVCFEATVDKYGRSFCTTPYSFMSIGRSGV